MARPVGYPWLRGPHGVAAPLAATIVALAAGCAGESESEPGVDDGRYHPPPNGVHVDEAAACDAVRSAVIDRALELGCSTTLRPCPELVRAQSGTACLEYDQGTVNGCVSYFAGQTACTGLDADACALVAFAGSDPAGCPP